MTSALALFDSMPAYITPEMANLGNEELGAEDFKYPQLKLLQPLSPELDTNADLKAGKFFNTLTGEQFDDVTLINIFVKPSVSVFKKKEFGGGFAGNYRTEAEARDHVATLPGDESHYQIQSTAVHYLLAVDADGKVSPIVYYMKGTALTVSKSWNTLIAMQLPNQPRFAGAWKLSPEKKSNAKGSWYLPKIEFLGYVPEHIFEEAKKIYDSLAKGE